MRNTGFTIHFKNISVSITMYFKASYKSSKFMYQRISEQTSWYLNIIVDPNKHT